MCVKTILVVDDDKITCEIIAAVLKDHGFAVKIAYSGEEAIDKFQRSKFNAVLTDLEMGKVDGNEVVRYVKLLSPQTIAVIITGYSGREHENLAYRNGADAFLAKPFDIDDLLRIIPAAVHLPECFCS